MIKVGQLGDTDALMKSYARTLPVEAFDDYLGVNKCSTDP